MRCTSLILNQNLFIYFSFLKKAISSCQNLAQNHTVFTVLKLMPQWNFASVSVWQNIHQNRISLWKGNRFVVLKTFKSSLGQNRLWRSLQIRYGSEGSILNRRDYIAGESLPKKFSVCFLIWQKWSPISREKAVVSGW